MGVTNCASDRTACPRPDLVLVKLQLLEAQSWLESGHPTGYEPRRACILMSVTLPGKWERKPQNTEHKQEESLEGSGRR